MSLALVGGRVFKTAESNQDCSGLWCRDRGPGDSKKDASHGAVEVRGQGSLDQGPEETPRSQRRGFIGAALGTIERSRASKGKGQPRGIKTEPWGQGA